VAPIKVSLGIALGATAPLVAFGLLEPGISHPPPTQKAAAPTVQVETPLTFATGLPPAQKPVHATLSPATVKSPQPHAGSHTVGGESVGVSHGSADGQGGNSAPTPSDPGSPPPPGEDQAAPTKVTICHHTDSKGNPEVTIEVAEDAVDALLAHGDQLGACAG